LIKYHDKFLNEGEIIYDNLKLLAEELGNKRELFYLLIDVKDADAKAKSIDVYNKYKLTKSKYLDFATSYFENMQIDSKSQLNVITNSEDSMIVENNETNNLKDNNTNDEKISNLEYNEIVEDIINRKRLTTMYQPIIDCELKEVYGYEMLTKIEYTKNINTEEFLKYLEETRNKNKIQQVMFVDCIDNFLDIKVKESNTAFVNVDLESYKNYVNKPRIYDAMNKIKLVFDLHGYEKFDLTNLQNSIKEIQEKQGRVCLDHFGVGVFTMDDLKLITPDYIKLDRSFMDNIEEDEERQKFIINLQTFCLSRNIKLIVLGVEDEKIYNLLSRIGIKYMQGYYLAYPSYSIDILKENLKSIIDNSANDSVV
jgi:EAL domain-containing protein (putative c-di-GMP-specific phosphodiesterase class I)